MQHILAERSGDLLVVDALGARGGRLRLVNVYSAPQGGNSLRQGAGIRELSSAPIDGRHTPALVAGDFNAYHRSWSTAASASKRSPGGIKLHSWAKTGRWDLGLGVGTVTRRGAAGEQDSAIDLVFTSHALTANGWTTTCAVRPDLATGSDHYPIIAALKPPQPMSFRDEDRPLNFKRTNWEQFASLLASRRHQLSAAEDALRQALGTAQEQTALDSAFTDTQLLLTSCLRATTPRVKRGQKGCQFWDAECDDRLAEMRLQELALSQTRAVGGDEQAARARQKKAAKEFERQLSRSKRTHFDSRLEELSGNFIFKAMKWSKGGTKRENSPPLIGEDGVARVEGKEKMALLREVLLAPPMPTDQQLPDLHQRLDNTLPDQPLRKDELRAAVFGQAQDKAAGPDGIPFRALRQAWPVLEERLFFFFGRALAVGWHPRPFRQADLVVLAKGGKRDFTKARSYRLIALLPTLGKVLEKIVAARLSALGLQHGWIASEQFGSVPGRSTSDTALTLVHDVEAGWTHAQPLITSALACDVRGAYDAVHYILLVNVLHGLGVPLHLVRWVLSFLLERQARMRLDGEESGMEDVRVGIPQGSPVSPVLYILFAASLHRRFGPSARDPDLRRVRLISYVDDELFYVISGSAADNARILRKAYAEALQWATTNGLRFDADKKEFVQFVAPRSSPPVEEALLLHDGEVLAVPKQSSFRWLGIHFDPQLKFDAHVDAVTTAVKKAAAGMSMLMNTRKGMKVVYSRRLYIACLRSKLVFGAEVWWRGAERTEPGRPHTKKKKDRITGRRLLPPPDPDRRKRNDESAAHAKRLDSAQHVALLRALPAYKTTSREALQQEASCPPMDLVLDQCLDQAAIRLARLDRHHPLRARVEINTASAVDGAVPRCTTPSRAIKAPVTFDSSRKAVTRPFSTRLTALARRLPQNIEPPTDVLARGSHGRLSDHPSVHIEGNTDWAMPDAGSGHEQCTTPGSLQVYTDGSMLNEDDRTTGAGWIIYRDAMVLERNHVCTGPSVEVFDAEATALMNGTFRALQLAAAMDSRAITVYVDNQSVLQALRADSASSSTQTFAVISYHVQAFLDVARNVKIHFRWVRGHSNVAGNEAADTEAKIGAMIGLGTSLSSRAHSVSFATQARRCRERMQERWQERWRQERDATERAGGPTSVYSRTRHEPPHLRPSRLHACLSRREFALVLHLRTGHGDFSEYHERFRHDDANTECLCGDKLTRLHPLRCSAFSMHHALLQDDHGQPLDETVLLGSDRGAKTLVAFARASKAFSAHRTRASLEGRTSSPTNLHFPSPQAP